MKGRPGACWGNVFLTGNSKSILAEKWICLGFMVKMNDTMDDSDGEQAFWIDGKKIQHFGKGFPKSHQDGGYVRENTVGTDFGGFNRWTTQALKSYFFWFNYYMIHVAEGNIEQIWFDYVVISTDYVGPL